MGAILKGLAIRIYASIEQRVHFFEPRILAFSIVAIIAFPLYYFVWHDMFPQPYENLSLRLAGSAIFVPFLFFRIWPHWLRRYLSIYWYLAILYGLPFFFTFMLLKNGGSTAWLLSTLIAIFLMILLLDWLNLLIQSAVGGGIAWIAYSMTSDVSHVNTISPESIPIYLFAIILGSIANYSAEILQKERLRAMLSTASNIAHELRTPLLGIKSGAAGLQHYLPVLMETYQMAKERGLEVKPIRLAHLDAMSSVLTRMEDEADHSNTIIDILLMNTRSGDFRPDGLSECSIAKCINTALHRYPFLSEKERKQVVWDNDKDFNFQGVELLMVHVIFNLMKNALYHIARADKGSISIRLERTPNKNILVFGDTGTGIPPEVLPHIFTRFYSWAPDSSDGLGAGIGLAFCRSVMKAFGGTITCQSRLGEYTEFTLTFPVEKTT